MNTKSLSNFLVRLRHKILISTRFLEVNTKFNSFALQQLNNSIQRIYVINLDRKPDRWNQITRELKRIREWSGKSLFSITRRFSAIDARYVSKRDYIDVLKPEYSLADQLRVEPSPYVTVDYKSESNNILMSPQEIAIALSHIEVWKLIASSNIPYTLILEDDVYFCRNFSKSADSLWNLVVDQNSKKTAFDLLYLSFQEVGIQSLSKKLSTNLVHKPDCGLWQASGYVLSREGAKKLIRLLPAYGPVDLWLNLQFSKLDVLVAQQPIIEQRVDIPSTNNYSIMSVLSQIGIYTSDKPLVNQLQKLISPIFVYGKHGTGLSSIAKALSMLGYTCCSDINQLPPSEINKLLAGKYNTTFNSYVNIGSFYLDMLIKMTKIYPKARFIFTSYNKQQSSPVFQNRKLYLPQKHSDKWEIISKFLNCAYPAFSYPICKDIGQRKIKFPVSVVKNNLPKHLKFDTSPWIVQSKVWHGIFIDDVRQNRGSTTTIVEWINNSRINDKCWKLRDDTFPSNLAIFSPNNVTMDDLKILNLNLKKQSSPVRSFSSGAISTRQTYLYGRFAAKIRPSNVSGLITGIFLHRNSPHQEIDIEFLGKDTTKILVNVFYNPGVNGTKLEYGYRGTPTLIELGFDASKNFHSYEIEWKENIISWFVNGKVVYQRILWNPTPIPDLPMEFNINLWYSRSKELAGNIDLSKIPSNTGIKSICIKQ